MQRIDGNCRRRNLVCVQDMLARSEEECSRVTAELDRARRSAGGGPPQEQPTAPGASADEVLLTGMIMSLLFAVAVLRACRRQQDILDVTLPRAVVSMIPCGFEVAHPQQRKASAQGFSCNFVICEAPIRAHPRPVACARETAGSSSCDEAVWGEWRCSSGGAYAGGEAARDR